MVTFSGIPNELVIAISSHLWKPSDILHLLLADRRTYRLIKPLLYENICIDEDFVSLSQTSYPKALTLANALNKNHFGSSVHNLELNLDFACQRFTFKLATLLQYLTKLKRFELNATWKSSKRCSIVLTPSRLEFALDQIRNTIESISLCIDTVIAVDDPTATAVLSFRHFKVLKHLCIPSPLFIKDGNGVDWSPRPKFADALPPTLETLELLCCPSSGTRTVSVADKAAQVAVHFSSYIIEMLCVVGDGFRALPVLRYVKLSVLAPGLTQRYRFVNGLERIPLGQYFLGAHEALVQRWGKRRKVKGTVDKTGYGQKPAPGSVGEVLDRIEWIVETI
ncbi:hypothetical protein P7C71_g5401, partial [Lecanoromycetidae sp. Uapishka_2]